MTTNAAAPTTTETPADAILRQLRELTAVVESQTGARLAVTRKRIADLEYEAELLDLEYTPYIKPTAYTVKWTMTEDELRARLVKATALAADTSKRELIRERASKDVESLTAQAIKRGLIADTTEPVEPATDSDGRTAGDKLDAVSASVAA